MGYTTTEERLGLHKGAKKDGGWAFSCAWIPLQYNWLYTFFKLATQEFKKMCTVNYTVRVSLQKALRHQSMVVVAYPFYDYFVFLLYCGYANEGYNFGIRHS